MLNVEISTKKKRNKVTRQPTINVRTAFNYFLVSFFNKTSSFLCILGNVSPLHKPTVDRLNLSEPETYIELIRLSQ